MGEIHNNDNLSRIGDTLRELREEKDMSQEEVVFGVCDTQVLADFESGCGDITTNMLEIFLEAMEVSLTEFALAMQHGQMKLSKKELFFRKISRACQEEDLFVFNRLLKEKNAIPFSGGAKDVCILLISDYIHDFDPKFPVPKKKIPVAVDYFLSIKKWGIHDLKLFAGVSYLLPLKVSCPIAEDLVFRDGVLCDEREKEEVLNSLMLNLSYACIQQGYLEQAELLLNTAANRLIRRKKRWFIVERIVLQYMEGYYQLVDGEKEEGTTKMMYSISMLASVGEKEMARKFQNYYEEAIVQSRRGRGLDY